MQSSSIRQYSGYLRPRKNHTVCYRAFGCIYATPYRNLLDFCQSCHISTKKNRANESMVLNPIMASSSLRDTKIYPKKAYLYHKGSYFRFARFLMIPVGITPVNTGHLCYRHVKSNSSQTLDTSTSPKNFHLTLLYFCRKTNLDRGCRVSSSPCGSTDISMY